jgi:hypothetical protein
MLLVNHVHLPNALSLAVIVGTLLAGIVASVWATRREQRDD